MINISLDELRLIAQNRNKAIMKTNLKGFGKTT